jgi:phosphoribosyl 1,2-cyclic phosphodiesterase
MKISQIGSSSKGNAILIDDGKTKALLDAGLAFKDLQTKLPCRLSDIECALITHSHGDHVKAVPELLRRGVHCYASEGTWGSVIGEIQKWPAISCYHKLSFQEGSFEILPFNVKHDVQQPFGYLIRSHHTGERLIYAVDTGQMWFTFKGINYFLIEANHCKHILDGQDMDEKLKFRIANNHLSIQKLTAYLMASDMTHAKEIHLLHLSNSNSNEKQFVRDLQAQFGVPVYVHGE